MEVQRREAPRITKCSGVHRSVATMPDIVVHSDLPPPLVDFVPTLQWYTLQAGLGNMLKKITTIVAAGASQLNGSPSTYNEVYVNAPGPVTITMPHDNLLIQ